MTIRETREEAAMSKNTNCLEGAACPKCGQDDYIRVEGKAVFILTDAGTDGHAGARYDDDSWANCHECNFTGTLKDFREDG